MIHITSLISRGWRERGPRRNSFSDTTNVDQVCSLVTGVRLMNMWEERKLKYLRKNYHHHIKCAATTFLTALMWRRPLNSAALAATTHRRLKWVSDGIGTQVGTQMINKCKVQMTRKELYNLEEPPWDERGGGEESNLNHLNIPLWSIFGDCDLLGLIVHWDQCLLFVFDSHSNPRLVVVQFIRI